MPPSFDRSRHNILPGNRVGTVQYGTERNGENGTVRYGTARDSTYAMYRMYCAVLYVQDVTVTAA